MKISSTSDEVGEEPIDGCLKYVYHPESRWRNSRVKGVN